MMGRSRETMSAVGQHSKKTETGLLKEKETVS